MSKDSEIGDVLGVPTNKSNSLIEDGSAKSLEETKQDYFKDVYQPKVYDLRIQLAWATFFLVVIWLIADLAIIFFSGIHGLSVKFIYTVIGSISGLITGLALGSFLVCMILSSEKIFSVHHKQILKANIPFYAGTVVMIFGGVWGASYMPEDILLPFNLSDPVLITMITTTTASLPGINRHSHFQGKPVCQSFHNTFLDVNFIPKGIKIIFSQHLGLLFHGFQIFKQNKPCKLLNLQGFKRGMVLGPGLEPGTNRLKVYCSTN